MVKIIDKIIGVDIIDIKFVGHESYAEKSDEEAYYMIGIADDKNDDKSYIILQRAYEFDDEDKVADIDSYYVEVNSQDNSAYNCIDNVTISKDSIVFNMIKSKLNDISSVSIDISKIELVDSFREYLNLIVDKALVKMI